MNTKTETEELQKLPEIVTNLKGVGIPGLMATLVKRTKNKAWYLRNDGVHEVFLIKISKANELFGKKYPRREHYPGNEDFGNIAWCYNGKQKNGYELAEKKYSEI